jgi:uncharacterized protein (TIGR02147 family)
MSMLMQTRSARSYLGEELARRLRANPRYSQRAFARQLGLSAGELSEVLRGKRALGLKSALRVARALGLTPAETRHLLALAQVERSQALAGGRDGELLAPLSEQELHARQLTLDMFHIVSDWYCFGILTLAECDDFRTDPAWIARRLGLSRGEVRVALERLERVGLIERKGRGFVAARDYVLSPDGIPSEAIRSYHKQILARAIDAVDAQPVPERSFRGVGFAFDPRQLDAVKKDIGEFLDALVKKYQRGRRTEVYYLETALFRLTGGDHERKT